MPSIISSGVFSMAVSRPVVKISLAAASRGDFMPEDDYEASMIALSDMLATNTTQKKVSMQDVL
jgi:hypothetical protein